MEERVFLLGWKAKKNHRTERFAAFRHCLACPIGVCMNSEDKGDGKIFKVLMVCKTVLFWYLCSGDTVKLVV